MQDSDNSPPMHHIQHTTAAKNNLKIESSKEIKGKQWVLNIGTFFFDYQGFNDMELTSFSISRNYYLVLLKIV